MVKWKEYSAVRFTTKAQRSQRKKENNKIGKIAYGGRIKRIN